MLDVSGWQGNDGPSGDYGFRNPDDTSDPEFSEAATRFYAELSNIFDRILDEIATLSLPMIFPGIICDWPEVAKRVFRLFICRIMEFPRWPFFCINLLPRPPPRDLINVSYLFVDASS